ncbi:hypothetical protein AAC899_07650 [Acinetobacter soli]|uniref:hypothetical protein n=1 Tax=Acinetobacter TaxID=469 RepID=UPI0031BA01F0
MNKENYNSFVKEQIDFFNEYIQPHFNEQWDDTHWQGGIHGSGWLLSRTGKTYFNFENVKKLKGLKNQDISTPYQEFMKAVLVLSYRKSNLKASPQKLASELLVLKRWYDSLNQESQSNDHPCSLSTSVLTNSFNILKENASKANLPDHAGTYKRLQELINHYGFTERSLEFSEEFKYLSRYNRTPNARKTRELIESIELDDDELDKEKLISIRTFINIVSLISLCETAGEKIVLNLLLLLIVTGLRSTEAILLQTDCLIKKPILDPVTKEHLTLDGIKQYTLGIKYYGAKGAGHRIHWVEPLAANLIETIVNAVLELTKECRQHVSYLRSKQCRDFLPKTIDDIPTDYIKVDDLLDNCIHIRETSRGERGRRDLLCKSLKNYKIFKVELIKSRNVRFYHKDEINRYLTDRAKFNIDSPINHIFKYEGETVNIPYEKLLFLHEYGSTTLSRAFINKANVVPLTLKIINSFLGNDNNISVFEKYHLFESEGVHSKLTSHIPRHNINTFLALSGISEHLQAVLMGRVDTKQNQYYQHLALKDRRVASSILDKYELTSSHSWESSPAITPVEFIKHDGLMHFSQDLDLENNLKMNLQSFDSKKEVATYIKQNPMSEYFDDIFQSFNELMEDETHEKDKLIERHAYLHPLPFGGCMREIAVHNCPKRLSCQSGSQCGNFALTGRKGELEALHTKHQSLLNQYNELKLSLASDESYSDMLNELAQNLGFLKELEEKALLRQKDLIPIQIFPYSENNIKLPTTLSELFAIEQKKLETEEN